MASVHGTGSKYIYIQDGDGNYHYVKTNQNPDGMTAQEKLSVAADVAGIVGLGLTVLGIGNSLDIDV
jgi:hypothetical protein